MLVVSITEIGLEAKEEITHTHNGFSESLKLVLSPPHSYLFSVAGRVYHFNFKLLCKILLHHVVKIPMMHFSHAVQYD